ncbi:MAG TPA: hypothetical protein ENN21_06545 [Spirochaetes bacterium]|nr:hypothetical protein [Spirochaetota bacterium]
MNSEETAQASGAPPAADNKRNRRRFLYWAAAALLLLLAGVLIISAPSYTVLIRDTDSRYYRAKKVLLIGDRMLCLREPGDHQSRSRALAGGDVSFGPSFISMKTVAFIEIIPAAEEAEEADTGPMGFPARYLGMYRVNAAGNDGQLFLGVKDGRVYGFIRFPDWGKGAAEPLKGLRLTAKKIQFVRSITTLNELNRTGANTYFTQQYYGEFTSDGKGIQGFYLVTGQKKQWQAYRAR